MSGRNRRAPFCHRRQILPSGCGALLAEIQRVRRSPTFRRFRRLSRRNSRRCRAISWHCRGAAVCGSDPSRRLPRAQQFVRFGGEAEIGRAARVAFSLARTTCGRPRARQAQLSALKHESPALAIIQIKYLTPRMGSSVSFGEIGAAGLAQYDGFGDAADDPEH